MTAVYARNAGLPAAAVGAGNTYMTEIAKMAPTRKGSKQRMEEVLLCYLRGQGRTDIMTLP